MGHVKRFAHSKLNLRATGTRSGIPNGSTVLIHVGKSGGSSLRSALKESPFGDKIYNVHYQYPPIRRNLEYYIVLRNPVRRALSAFHFRYRQVLVDQSHPPANKDECSVLKRYGTLNTLALNLYDDAGTPNPDAIAAIEKIGHIKRNIAFYLDPLLWRIDPQQVKDVLVQETLDADIARVFGIQNTHKKKPYGQSMRQDQLELTPRAVANLRRYLTKDYACLAMLHCWGKIGPEIYASEPASATGRPEHRPVAGPTDPPPGRRAQPLRDGG